MIRNIILILFLVFVLFAQSNLNANPCAYDLFLGRQAYHGTPQPDISIQAEKINITIALDYYPDKEFPEYSFIDVDTVDFSIDYTFQNNGEEKKLVMGFPIGTVRDDNITSFEVTQKKTGDKTENQKNQFRDQLNLTGADLRLCEAGYFKMPGGDEKNNIPNKLRRIVQKKELALKPGRNVQIQKHVAKHRLDWFVWEQTFGPKETTEINVNYFLKSDGASTLSYILSTSRFWGDGTIKDLEITVKFKGKSHVPQKLLKNIDALPEGFTYNKKKRQLYWHLTDFNPDQDLEIYLHQGG